MKKAKPGARRPRRINFERRWRRLPSKFSASRADCRSIYLRLKVQDVEGRYRLALAEVRTESVYCGNRQQAPACADLGRLTLLTILSKFTQSNEHGGNPGV